MLRRRRALFLHSGAKHAVPRLTEPGLWLPSPDVDRWSYIARFSAYQGDATVALTFFDESASRRTKSRHIFIPQKVAFPETATDVRNGILDVIVDWGVILSGACSLRPEGK